MGKMPTKVPAGQPRWNALPEGPMLRMFEVMAAQDDGRHRVRSLGRAFCYSHLIMNFGKVVALLPVRVLTWRLS